MMSGGKQPGSGSGILLNNLFAFYSLEEASGARADSHTGGYTLTDNNTVTQAAGVVGNAASFAAATLEYLSRADEAALRFGDANFCMAGWVYMADKAATRVFASKLGAAGTLEWEVFYNLGADRYRFLVSGDGTANTTISAVSHGSPAAAAWTFLYAEHNADANTIGISINDGPLDTAAHTTGIFGGAAPFVLGATGVPNLYHNGNLDQWGFWKGRVLAPSSRTWLYNGGSGRSYAALAAY